MSDNENPTDAAFEELADATIKMDVGRTDTKMEDELKRANLEVLKAQAEFENFRKRMRREMEDDRKFALQPFVTEILPVLDNLDRALEAAEKTESGGGLLAGVKMVATQLQGVLSHHGVKEIPALGTEFDPHLHQALMQEPSEVPANHVSRVMQRGFSLNNRVIRPAQVFVSSGPAS